MKICKKYKQNDPMFLDRQVMANSVDPDLIKVCNACHRLASVQEIRITKKLKS